MNTLTGWIKPLNERLEDAMTVERDEMAAVLRVDHDRAHAKEPLRECVREAIESYLAELDGHATKGLYGMVISEVEAPLLETVMHYTRGNQSRAAELLGLNRGTLRKKLKQYALD